ncbi:hypothetical protein MGL_3145 [Malassezia globosa CBS 7966]|uniref:RlpA-like protein double-psi beta-barrel domain-containing protein n=1 Tax=Malassezia globosa (strain ATCC MYA-4612 / CBS 7966) TaxID=425265 RepID=A8Q7W7_MALGO|nr:uncharacterized protein MGL_3145 [Malassezia globosa CBS 7966]EDP42387.1 hypothetical protein MGL_3145 [Malassezia globosa CBS 7966]
MKTFLVALVLGVGIATAFLDPEVLEANVKNSSAHTLRKRSAFSGTATWYDVETYQAGACGYDIDNSMHIVALNEPMYGDLDSRSKWCGKHIMIANGLKTVRAVIMDACPETSQCHHGSLDMSMSLFQEFNDLTLGVFPITWWTIDDSHNDDGDKGRGNGGGKSNSGSASSDSRSQSHSYSRSHSHSQTHSHSRSYSSSTPTSSSYHEHNASRSSAQAEAAASASSARARASSIAREQSLSKASAASSRSSASEASLRSKSSESASHDSSSTRVATSSSDSHSSSTTASSSSSQTTGSSSQDDPRVGNLENFVKVLNGLSMLVHAAAQN